MFTYKANSFLYINKGLISGESFKNDLGVKINNEMQRKLIKYFKAGNVLFEYKTLMQIHHTHYSTKKLTPDLYSSQLLARNFH